MGIFDNAISGYSSLFTKPVTSNFNSNITLNAKDAVNKSVLPWKPQALTQTQSDIKTWKEGEDLYYAEEPKNYAIQQLLTNTLKDNTLSSQIENRINNTLSLEWSLKNKSDEIDVEQTKKLKNSPAFRKIMTAILKSQYFGYSLIELKFKLKIDGEFDIDVTEIPRTNVVPQNGRFYYDFLEDKFINYREIQEFGTYIIEFNQEDIGLLNKAVPNAMFKRFSMSCWSELCEIYGIPPRFMKTNTQDPAMLARAEQMMKDMGSAAWFIIDNHEEFEFAKGTVSKGEVYDGLIQLCNNEMSMLITGAIIGQDTKNGSNGKEASSQELFKDLVKSDMELSEQSWNQIVVPALIQLGFITSDLRFEFYPSIDLDALWERTIAILPYAEFDDKGVEWIRTTFGVEISSMKKPTQTQLNVSPDFFV